MPKGQISASSQDLLRRKATQLLRDWRRSLSWSQAKLGAEVGLSQSVISRMESGNVDVPAWLVMHILHAELDSAMSRRPEMRTLLRLLETLPSAHLRAIALILGRG